MYNYDYAAPMSGDSSPGQEPELTSYADEDQVAEAGLYEAVPVKAAARDDEPVLAGDEELAPLEEDFCTVRFKVEPSVLQAGLREVTSAMKQTTGTIYFAALKDETSDFALQNAIAPELGPGRLVIGAQGTGRNHTFVDIPVLEVERQGAFIINEAARLQAYAAECTRPITIEHMREDDTVYLVLHHGAGRKRMPILILYDEEDLDAHFPPVNDRFSSPEEPFSSEAMAQMLTRADKLSAASPGSARTGDVIWTTKSIEYATLHTASQHNIGSSQKVAFDSEFAFEWEVTPEQLKVLGQVSRIDGATFRYDDEDDEAKPVFQLAFARKIGKSDLVMYVHRQLAVDRENEPIKKWGYINDEGESDDSVLFGLPACRLFATVPSEALFGALRRFWALDAATVRIERSVDEDGHPTLELLSNDASEMDCDRVDAYHGDSEVPFYLLRPDVIKSLETMVDAATQFQIRSFPTIREDEDTGEEIAVELPNAFLVVPLGEDDDPTVPKNDPDRYLLVSWQV